MSGSNSLSGWLSPQPLQAKDDLHAARWRELTISNRSAVSGFLFMIRGVGKTWGTSFAAAPEDRRPNSHSFTAAAIRSSAANCSDVSLSASRDSSGTVSLISVIHILSMTNAGFENAAVGYALDLALRLESGCLPQPKKFYFSFRRNG